MINARLTESGGLVLAVVGNDIEGVKALPETLKAVPKGLSVNPKTGRKHYIVSFEPVEDNSALIESLEKQLAAAKREVIKLKAAAKQSATKADPTKETE